MINIIPNQPIRLIPSGGTEFNQLNQCGCTPRYFSQLYNIQDDPQLMVGIQPVTGDELITNGNFNEPISLGTATSTSAGLLIDAGATFISDGVTAGMTVENLTDSTIALVASVDSQTQLTLTTGGVYTAAIPTGEDYQITGWKGSSNTAFGSMVVFNNAFAGAPATTYGILPTYSQVIAMKPNSLYRVLFTVTNRGTGDDSVIDCYFDGLTSDDGVYGKQGGHPGIAQVVHEGQHEYWVLTGSTLNNSEITFIENAARDINISNVSVIEYGTIGWALKDIDTGLFDYIETDNVNVRYSGGVGIIQADLTQVDPGCYQIFVYDKNADNIYHDAADGEFYLQDTDNKITNGTFDADTDWSYTPLAGWSIAAGVATKVAGTADDLTQVIADFSVGQTYVVRITATVTAGTLTVKQGTQSIVAITSPGSYEVAFTADASGPQLNISAGNTYAGTVDNVSVYELTLFDTAIETGDILPTYCSEFIKTAESFDCTVLLSWKNDDEDAKGVDYGLLKYDIFKPDNAASNPYFDFLNKLRVEAKVMNPTIKDDTNNDEQSNNTSLLFYDNERKVHRLILQELPASLMRVIAFGLCHFQFYIDGEQYVKSENESYEPQWTKEDLFLAPSIISVEQFNQDNFLNSQTE